MSGSDHTKVADVPVTLAVVKLELEIGVTAHGGTGITITV
jgi:hypothetical protein